jgi:aryl-alcohol dehydrogenase-like predicted oxidoreductase
VTDEDFGLSRKQIHKQIDLSLKRLGTDYVDLYQCHRYDHDTPLEETMQALSEVVRAGKARYIGYSEWGPEQIEAAFKIPGTERFVSSQPQYSMLWRDPEGAVFPLCAREGVGSIVFSPLAQGVLSGKYKRGAPPPSDSRASSERMGGFIRRWLSDEKLAVVERLEPIAREAGMTLSQLALAWILRRPEVSSAIIGATRPEQVAENAAASDKTLAPETLKAVEAVLS